VCARWNSHPIASDSCVGAFPSVVHWGFGAAATQAGQLQMAPCAATSSSTARDDKRSKKVVTKSALSTAITRYQTEDVWLCPKPVCSFGIWRYQRRARAFYQHSTVQWAVAGLIFANFICNIVEKQIDPFGEKYPEDFQVMEDLFNVIFLIELIVNAYGAWFFRFWSSGWNVFDVLVVSVGCLSLFRVQLPESMSMLRMLRAFRVFRLFKRIKSLNKIVVSLGNAVPGILNAAFVMLLVMCIYCILGVEFFGKFADEEWTYVSDECLERDEMGDACVLEVGAIPGTYTSLAGDEVNAITARRLAYGPEYFGTFMATLFTMFQLLTGESWTEAIARPIIFGGPAQIWCSLFFVSFIIVNGFVLINVVVAVLLEKLAEPEPEDPDEPELDNELRAAIAADTPMSPRRVAPAPVEGQRLSTPRDPAVKPPPLSPERPSPGRVMAVHEVASPGSPCDAPMLTAEDYDSSDGRASPVRDGSPPRAPRMAAKHAAAGAPTVHSCPPSVAVQKTRRAVLAQSAAEVGEIKELLRKVNAAVERQGASLDDLANAGSLAAAPAIAAYSCGLRAAAVEPFNGTVEPRRARTPASALDSPGSSTPIETHRPADEVMMTDIDSSAPSASRVATPSAP